MAEIIMPYPKAWNRFDIKQEWYSLNENTQSTRDVKVYLIRENVLKPIWEELKVKEYGGTITRQFSYVNFKWLIKEYGKTNQQIAEEVKEFVSYPQYIEDSVAMLQKRSPIDKSPNFYAYFADYDWVVFCWLFGNMVDLPNGFPLYCRDLKQMLDESFLLRSDYQKPEHHPNYPKQTNEHNALADAKWNKELHKFICSL